MPYDPREFPNMGNTQVNFGQPTTPARQTPSFVSSPQQAQPQGQQAWWQNPNTQAALIGAGTSLVGGALAGREERAGQQANNDAAMQRLELQLQMEREQREREMAQRQAEQGLSAATKAPERQDWRQRQALMAAILPNARNFSVTPPGDLARFTPKMSGGFRIPEGGFDSSTLAFYSPEARAQAESDLDRQAAHASGGNYSVPNYANSGYGESAGNLQQDTQSYADKIREAQALQKVGQVGAQSPTTAARQTQSNVGANSRNQPQSSGPSTGQRVGNMALNAGIGYLASRYGGQAAAGTSPWWGAAIGALSGAR
jgi:hypothetical protein